MASALAPQALLKQSLSFCSRASSTYQRPVRQSRQDHGKPSAGRPIRGEKYRDYRQFRPPPTWKKKICLWKGNRNFGVMTVQEAITDFLGPGKCLSWRVADEVLRRLDSDHESRSTDASGGEVEASTGASDKGNTDILHYDIINFTELKKLHLNTAIQRAVREEGKYRLFCRCNAEFARTPRLQSLPVAYKVLAVPGMAARYPFEFRIFSPKDRKGPHDVMWALENRADLHPEVILRAMPAGARQLGPVRMRTDGTDAFFTIVAKDYSPRAPRAPKDEAQPDPPSPSKADRTQGPQAATGTQPQLSKESKIKFEHALSEALRKTEAHIKKKYQKLLVSAVRRRLKKFGGGANSPLPQERSESEEKMRLVIEQALLKVRANFERRYGIKTGATGVPEDSSLDGSEGVKPSRKTVTKDR